MVHRPVNDRNDYTPALFEFLCHLKGYGILIDEADQFAQPASRPRSFDNLINYQGHLGVDLYLVSRRAARIPRDVTALADRLCVFHTKEPNDLKYLKALTGTLTDDKLRSLPKYKYLEIEF